MNPLVSICCITYNHEKYIAQAIEGFLMQKTDFPIEIIIHDDASIDRTADIIREYEIKHPKFIKPIYQKENQWSKGIRPYPIYVWPEARGKYIAICEGDDYWTDPYKLQKQVSFLEDNEDYSFVLTNFDAYFENDKKVVKNFLTKQKDFYQNPKTPHELFTTYLRPLTWMMRAKYFDEILLDITSNYLIGDAPLYLYLAFKGKIGFIDESTGVYRINYGSLTQGNKIEGKLLLYLNNLMVRLFFAEKIYMFEKIFQTNLYLYYSNMLNKRITLRKLNKIISNYNLNLDITKFRLNNNIFYDVLFYIRKFYYFFKF